MDGSTATLRNSSTLLADVLALMGKVSSERDSWRASPAELHLLSLVSEATGQSLPAEAMNSASMTLGFLVNARFALGNKATVPALRRLTQPAALGVGHTRRGPRGFQTPVS